MKQENLYTKYCVYFDEVCGQGATSSNAFSSKKLAADEFRRSWSQLASTAQRFWLRRFDCGYPAVAVPEAKKLTEALSAGSGPAISKAA